MCPRSCAIDGRTLSDAGVESTQAIVVSYGGSLLADRETGSGSAVRVLLEARVRLPISEATR